MSFLKTFENTDVSCGQKTSVTLIGRTRRKNHLAKKSFVPATTRAEGKIYDNFKKKVFSIVV